MGSGASKQSNTARLPRYVDVDDVLVRPSNQARLWEDPSRQGTFFKMKDRPLMSLISDTEGGHRGGPGLPLGMRTDGIYFLPHLPTGTVGTSADPDAAAAGEEQQVPFLQTIAGREDRVYFLVGQGIVNVGERS